MRKIAVPIWLVLFCFANMVYAQTTSITEGRVTVGAGVSIHYLQSGPPNSPQTLILIPGWRLPAYLWSEQLKTFASESRVIAIDPRSQGDSTKTTEGNSPENRAKDLHEIIEKLKVSQPVLVGWSQGAQDVAAYIAQFGSDSIAGAVFVDSPVSIGPGEIGQHQMFSRIILGAAATYAAHPEDYSRGMIFSIFKKAHPQFDTEKLVQDTLKTPTDVGVAMLMLDIFGADRLAPLAKFTRPALVIAATESPLFEQQKQMAASIPGSKFVPFMGVGHALFVDDPVKFDQTLKEFLQGLSKTTTAQ